MKSLNSMKFWTVLNKSTMIVAFILTAVSMYCAAWMAYTTYVVTDKSNKIQMASAQNKYRAPVKVDFLTNNTIARPIDWSTVAPAAQATTVLISVAGGKFRNGRNKVDGFYKNPILEMADEIYQTVVNGKQKLTRENVRWKPYGSGVLMNNKGLIMTAAHVVSEYHLFAITTADGKEGFAQPVVIDDFQDIAILETVTTAGEEIHGQFGVAAKLAETAKLPAGTAVIAIGSPDGEPFLVSSGIVMGTKQNHAGNMYADLVNIDAKISGGNSGGGVFNRDGELIGIMSFTTDAGGFAVPIDRARGVLSQVTASEKLALK